MGSKITMYREKNLTYRTEILAYRDSRLDSMPVHVVFHFNILNRFSDPYFDDFTVFYCFLYKYTPLLTFIIIFRNNVFIYSLNKKNVF